MQHKHSSHETRFSDASTFDEVCIRCGATDITGGGWSRLALPCTANIADQSQPQHVYESQEIKTEDELSLLKEENKVLKDILHYINLHASITMNEKRVSDMISAICSWSYAYRCGNGEYSDEQQEKLIENAFTRIKLLMGNDLE